MSDLSPTLNDLSLKCDEVAEKCPGACWAQIVIDVMVSTGNYFDQMDEGWLYYKTEQDCQQTADERGCCGCGAFSNEERHAKVLNKERSEWEF